MQAAAAATEPTLISRVVLTITRGVAAGWIAGIPQVLVTQAEGKLVGAREQADIGPRFVRRATQHTGHPVSPPVEWLIAAVFHFEYAAMWGALYGALVEPIGWRRVPPLVGGTVLGGIIYTAAFSPLGGATRTGAVSPPERRPAWESLLHGSAAFSFGYTAAFAYRWLREQW
jgi:hypothetical protein